MQVGPGIISSRMFARDDRPVPNIVAIYEKPRLKVRRDATHVLGGMFGWNASEEVARALRSEDLSTRESTAAIASTPNSTPADTPLSGPPPRCVKRSTKRSKRRSIMPLSEMGASILSLSLQERMKRQQEVEEKRDHESGSTLVKSSISPLDGISTTIDSTAMLKKLKAAAAADPPVTKKLRLTISTAPPSATSVSTPLLQLPLSPPDTSSNASKAPTDEQYAGPVSSSTPRTAQLSTPKFELDLSNIAGLSLSTLDSDSDSDSSSESSSESSSDSPDLSSSTSTRSAPQDKTERKEKNASRSAPNKSQTTTSSIAASSTRNPSTPPRRKRRTHPPGWVGWVQTEESPDHSRLIRLDDAPVILGRRTRSGKEFAEPPPLRRRSAAGSEAKGRRQTKGAANSDRAGQNSKKDSAEQAEQNRSATEENIEGKMDGEHTPEAGEPGPSDKTPNKGVQEPPTSILLDPVPDKDVTTLADSPGSTAPALKRNGSSLGESTNGDQPVRATASPAKSSGNVLPTSQPSPIVVPTVLKLTRSDTVITPTGARPNEPQRKEAVPPKDSPSKPAGYDKAKNLGDLPIRSLPTLDSPRKSATQTSPEKNVRSSVKGTAQSYSRDTPAGLVSRPALGSSNSSTLINSAKPAPAGSNTSPNSTVKKSNVSVTGSSSRNPSVTGVAEKALPASRNLADKVQPAKTESWDNAIQLGPNSNDLNGMASNANPSTSLKVSSSTSKVAKPFPMTAPSRIEKSEPDSKPSPFIKLGTLVKRKDSSSPLPSGQSSSSSQSRVKKRKLVLSSSDESEGPRFIVNPFDRRAKKMELTRKGVSGEAFQAEMKKWMHAKKAEWKEKERLKEKQNERSSGNSEVRTAIAEGKPVSELVRHRLAGGSNSTRIGEAKLARNKVYNSDWGMDVAKVSVAGSSEKRTLPKPEAGTEKRDSIVKDLRETNAGKIKRESDASRDLAKPRRVAV
ncbi:hypothetical protein OPQ81_006159 [Rhizoctonia solani]|nr:hypothetical protein OPQ81_006159 [Rhizoctonia solani]